MFIRRACDFFDFPRFCHAQPTVVLKLPQGRHPERSASQIYRLTEGLWRAVEGPRRCLLAGALHSFPATEIMKEIKKVTSSERSRGICSAPFSQTKVPASELAAVVARLFLSYLGYPSMPWLTRDWLGSRSRQTGAASSLAGAFVWEKGALQIPRLRSG